MQEPAEPQDTPKVLSTPKLVDTSKLPGQESNQHAATPTESAAKPKSPGSASSSSARKSESHTASLLVIAFVTAALIAAIWYVSNQGGWPIGSDQNLAETRAKLTAASSELATTREAKAAVDRALAEAQAKLADEQQKRALAEKAIADIKAALASILTPAPPSASPKPAEPAKAPTPK